ncbi:MAG TPA: hypothetical protein VHC69_05920 [Polyangiaceae bacterium]|nr:hypothetical protein [Polyangiaceae bacterium]
MPPEKRKTLIALAVLAAAIGVYVEISYQQKLKEKGISDPAFSPPAASVR